ncbi:hypothetical protein N9K17_06145 [Burkholderiaceae bacterium]|nr:hypothetical protein [Burkholderiaceae bacterium]
MLPEAPRPVEEVNAQLVSARLDVRISAHQLNVAAKAQGLGDVTSFTDIEWGIRRTSTTERGDGAVATSSGSEMQFESAGTHTLKGLSDPYDLYRPLTL